MNRESKELLVGQPLKRIDGLAKVTGAARFAADAPLAGCVRAAIVESRVARARHENRGGGGNCERGFQRDRQARARFADYR